MDASTEKATRLVRDLSNQNPQAIAAMLIGLVLVALGLFTLFRALLALLSFVYQHFLRPSASFKKYKGKWAVVTGASAGLGEAFARGLAKRGVNVVMLARSIDKLQQIENDLVTSGVQAKSIQFDFADPSQAQWNNIKAVFDELKPLILINNVGVNVDYPISFMEMPDEKIDQIVRVNIDATNKITKLLIPYMISSKSGVIYFMSSGAAIVPSVLLSVYGATKSYMDSLAVSLAGELLGYNIKVHSLTPFLVQSAMSKVRKPSLTVPTAKKFAEDSLNMMGHEVRSNPYWVHHLMGSVLSIFPLVFQINYILDLHTKINKAALRKIERENSQKKVQ